ncbi:MAG: glycosyltransferase [Acidobacteriota bacterium]
MNEVIARVLRSEGTSSAIRRTGERAAESMRLQALLARGLFARDEHVPLLNVSGMPPVARLGGLPIQLRARLDEERALRDVALFYPNLLEVRSHARRVRGLEEAVERTGARIVHVEGTFGVPLERVLRLDVELVLSLHDLALLDEPEPLRRELFSRARAVIFPSAFLRSAYGVAGEVIEPASPAPVVEPATGPRTRIAYAGSLKRHKGARLLPEIIAATNAEWHLFGGGDEDLIEAVRVLPRVTVHGYYRAGTLPSLLTRHRIGLALLPSIVPESFGLTLSECWRAGVPAVAFAHGALGERITRQGGGWLVPLDQGATGLRRMIGRWVEGELQSEIPTAIATPCDAANAHLALYATLLG